MRDKTQAFIDALGKLEKSGDADPIAGLFSDNADVSNPMVDHHHEGEQGAKSFWTSYRKAFDEIQSEFLHVVENGDMAMLEWRSTGSIDGKQVHYGGVSVLEHGANGIVAFRSYFNPASV